ncbi:unnamed protein product, partial [Litomosoides sigmodontis]
QLKQGITRVMDLLTSIQDKLEPLKMLANENQKNTLNKIGSIISQINNFQKTVFNSKMEFSQKENTWESLVKKIFVGEGLNAVIPLLKMVSNGAPAIPITYLLTCVLPLLTNVLHQ